MVKFGFILNSLIYWLTNHCTDKHGFNWPPVIFFIASPITYSFVLFYLCLISLLYLDLYVLGDDAFIS